MSAPRRTPSGAWLSAQHCRTSPAGLCPRAPRRQHGGQSIDVRSNDVVFSIHANAATALTLVQICVYQRGDQLDVAPAAQNQ